MAKDNTSIPSTSLVKHPDILMSVGVVGILMVMLVPLPRFFLDLLLSFNITLSIIILLVGMQVRRPLEFSVFPSILLMVTLLRLALNIASTRLILLHGNEGAAAAGEVIRAFGNFVVGGNYTVGLVVFTILVIINFVVITKGAGRVAEVAARFTLDAMPGKQMAIDADLNAGLINDKEARQRRKEIAQEADFYGAMDGSSKFVRGDAVAAVVITLVNILGGLTIGVLQQGMTVAAAAQTYTLLTVGEGLVAQVPALIVSTAAGIVITRAASEVNLGFEITRQVLISPKAIGTASGILLAMGLVPGLPHLAFLALGSLTGWMAFQLNEHQKTAVATPEPESPQVKAEEAATQVVPLDLMEVQVGYGLIGLVDGGQGGALLDRIKGLRRQFAEQMGFVLPPIHIRDNLQLRPNEYAALLKGVELAKSEVMPAHVLAIDPGTAQRGIIHGLPTKEPAFGLPALWVPEQQREQAQMAGYTVVDPGSAIATHLSELIKRHAHELLGRQEVQGLLDQLGKNHPKLVEEVVPNLIPLGTLVRVLSHLLREGVPIRDLRTILETLADHAASTKDADILTEVARQALGRTITKQYLAPDGSLPIIGLDPRLDRTLADQANAVGQGNQWIPDPMVAQKLLSALKQAAERMVGRGHQPVILCSPSLRRHLRKLTDRILHSVPILGLNEVDSVTRLQAMETVRLDLDGGDTRSLA
ncbi:MAG: flagellar biosynthesis protein FlhA [Nitrospira sp.]|nr:flagellar biosynthesis protein FlhA [Nitrospira sp.]MBX3341515.1 flagellar biosynthesis protein FlhA [Nitrospira sp.]MBX3369587.1 flagellar biosynthesis protein FlhA [Nitrospira sp.]MBX7038366.1 flagellar biosynthesis protein FlhA [Nitrospira sp.]MCW5795842.1 flagellar biosynthesis protein FlhA [Nitrospira sp.]